MGFGIERTHSDVLVRCDVGYLCASFSLPRPLCSRLRPDVRDRQTSDAHHRLMPPPYGGGAIIMIKISVMAMLISRVILYVNIVYTVLPFLSLTVPVKS